MPHNFGAYISSYIALFCHGYIKPGLVFAHTSRKEKTHKKVVKKVPKIVRKGDNLQQDMDTVASYVVK